MQHEYMKFQMFMNAHKLWPEYIINGVYQRLEIYDPIFPSRYYRALVHTAGYTSAWHDQYHFSQWHYNFHILNIIHTSLFILNYRMHIEILKKYLLLIMSTMSTCIRSVYLYFFNLPVVPFMQNLPYINFMAITPTGKYNIFHRYAHGFIMFL